jgi:hypothetical protein
VSNDGTSRHQPLSRRGGGWIDAIRRYTSDPIPDADLQSILNTVALAPS